MYAGGFKAEELVSLEAHYGQDNQAYYRVLRESLGPHYSPPQDVTSWVDYHVGAHAIQSQEAVKQLNDWQRELFNLANGLQTFSLTAFQVAAAWKACLSGRLTNRDYRNGFKRSAQEAVADFNTLIANGLLQRVGGGRSTAYVPSDKLRQLYSAAISDSK